MHIRSYFPDISLLLQVTLPGVAAGNVQLHYGSYQWVGVAPKDNQCVDARKVDDAWRTDHACLLREGWQV